MSTIKEKTLKYDLCINCGLCKAACPLNAIEMAANKYGELNPEINKKLCTNCGLCSEFCPNTKDKLRQEALKVTVASEPQAFGLENANYYAAWSKNKVLRQKCCSGGVATELARHLFENNKITGMIHVERLWSNRKELHYGARLSSSIEEIEKNVSSAYQPIDFSNVLKILKQGETYFITGTPCVIRGIKKLFGGHNKFKNINILTCALVCSHNTNAQFIDFLTEINELCDKEPWQVNIRMKDDTITDAGNFKNHIYTKEKDLLSKNRFESGWTDIWRRYYFAMNVCNYCTDFWGCEADISLKDAWGEWSSDPLGKNIVVIRNKELEKDFLNSNITAEILSYETMKNHQLHTSTYKQTEAKNKNFKSILSRSNRRNGLLKNEIISKTSKFLYKNFGFYITKKITKKLYKFLTPKEKKTNKNLFIIQLIALGKSIRKVFIIKEDKSGCIKQILVAGGYGYGNTGDEAQCAETLKLLTNRYPDYQTVNLTPNVDYSKKMHPDFYHKTASRKIFYDSGTPLSCYDFNNTNITFYKSFIFFVKSILIYLNALLIRADLPVFGINSGIAGFLYDMKISSLFYFCGGGYLTGSTLSRFWEGILLCRLAYLFKVPVVMSGQTIGVWNTKFNKYLAKWGFKHVKLITVRDEEFSIRDLKEIGLKGENIFPTHDDALFCEKSSEKQINCDNYITVNFHYWGMREEEKKLYTDKIQSLIKYITETANYNIVFIPMVSSDKFSYDDYIKKYPDDRMQCFEYDYDFKKVRRVIADSKLCITMKHHPIIFAMGETVPVISLAFSEYYIHKNLGALMQYKQEKFSINLESDDYQEKFKALFNNIFDNYDNIQATINERLNILKTRKNKFLKMTDDILGINSF